MSLTVNAYIRDEEGKMQLLHGRDWKALMQEWRSRGLSPTEMTREAQRVFRETEAHRELAGPEAWRRQVWGSECARSLGLTVLPSLSERDIYAEGEELLRLEKELAIFATHIPCLAQETGCDSEQITQRLENMIWAVKRAKEMDGGVVIW